MTLPLILTYSAVVPMSTFLSFLLQLIIKKTEMLHSILIAGSSSSSSSNKIGLNQYIINIVNRPTTYRLRKRNYEYKTCTLPLYIMENCITCDLCGLLINTIQKKNLFIHKNVISIELPFTPEQILCSLIKYKFMPLFCNKLG